MTYQNRNVYAFLLFMMIFMCLVFQYFFVLNKHNNDILTNANDKINRLSISNVKKQLYITSMQKQLSNYDVENNRLKAIVYSYKKEETKQPEQKENPDLKLLAQLIESESGNQSFEGKLAVGTVVMNRVGADGFPDTIKDVIYQKKQFSPVADGSINNEPSEDSIKAAKKILSGTRVLASDVLYFYNPKLTNDKWIKSLKVDKKIGDHVFS